MSSDFRTVAAISPSEGQKIKAVVRVRKDKVLGQVSCVKVDGNSISVANEPMKARTFDSVYPKETTQQ